MNEVNTMGLSSSRAQQLWVAMKRRAAHLPKPSNEDLAFLRKNLGERGDNFLIEGMFGKQGRAWAIEHFSRYGLVRSLVPNKRVLDCACGTGYGSWILAEFGAASVTGMDVSEQSILYARHRFSNGKLRFMHGDACSLPFPDASFDVVASIETLEHLKRPIRALHEFARVLRPGGVLIASLPGYNHILNPYHYYGFSPATAKQFVGRVFCVDDVFVMDFPVGTPGHPLIRQSNCTESLDWTGCVFVQAKKQQCESRRRRSLILNLTSVKLNRVTPFRGHVVVDCPVQQPWEASINTLPDAVVTQLPATDEHNILLGAALKRDIPILFLADNMTSVVKPDTLNSYAGLVFVERTKAPVRCFGGPTFLLRSKAGQRQLDDSLSTWQTTYATTDSLDMEYMRLCQSLVHNRLRASESLAREQTLRREYQAESNLYQRRALTAWRFKLAMERSHFAWKLHELGRKGITRLAIYGGGEHTLRLLKHVQGFKELSVVCIIDDNPRLVGRRLCGIPVLRTALSLSPQAILISSDSCQELLYHRARATYPDIPTIRLYPASLFRKRMK